MLLLLFFYTNISKPVDESGLLMLYFLFDTLFLVVLKHYIILEVVFLYFVSPIYCDITAFLIPNYSKPSQVRLFSPLRKKVEKISKKFEKTLDK